MPKSAKYITFYQIDIAKEKFPFSDNTIDNVIMHHVLEHLPKIDNTLREIVRVLKIGGRTVLLPSIHTLFAEKYRD